MSSACLETEDSFSGRRLYIQVRCSVQLGAEINLRRYQVV
jgi:hypothetical protein